MNYWQPEFSDTASKGKFEGMTSQLKELLQDAVRKDLETSGKTGAFLSGGLDSSTVTGVMAEICGAGAAAFSIGFAAEGYDEMAYARITARHFGVDLNEYYVTPQDVVDALPKVAISYDEPFGNSSALPAYFCARMAAENGISTLLAGDGGDEIFGGNERYIKQRVFEHYAMVPDFLRRGLIEPLIRSLPSALTLVAKADSYISQANTPLPDRMQSYNFLHRHPASDIFSDEILMHVDGDLPLALLRSVYHRPEQASDLNRMLYLDWQFTLADNDLRKVSNMCALAGVDVRYPMLDDALVEFACQVPSHWKIRGSQLRYFYKAALSGWLPRETIEKTKQGFGLPFGVWMQSYKPLRELAYDSLLKLKSRGYIRPPFIDKAIEMHQSQHAAYYGELVWILTVFELWLEGHHQKRPDDFRDN
ncbi:MAG: asparagine synthase C-terminal domain-containing protein [Halioglobus sp.]